MRAVTDGVEDAQLIILFRVLLTCILSHGIYSYNELTNESILVISPVDVKAGAE